MEIGQHTTHIQVAQLLAQGDGRKYLDAAFCLEAVLWEEAFAVQDRASGEKLHRHVQRLCATHPLVSQQLEKVQEYARLVVEGNREPGAMTLLMARAAADYSIKLHQRRREWLSFSQQPAVLECVERFDRKLSAKYQCVASAAIVETRDGAIPREYEDARANWCGIVADGSVLFAQNAILEPGRDAGVSHTPESWGRSSFEGEQYGGRFNSVEQALAFATDLTRWNSVITMDGVAQTAYDAGWLLAQLRRK